MVTITINTNAQKAINSRLACLEIDKKRGGDLFYMKQDFLAKSFSFP